MGAGLVPKAGVAPAAGIPGCQREASAHLERGEGAGEAPCTGSAGDQAAQTRASAEANLLGVGGSTAVRLNRDHAISREDADDGLRPPTASSPSRP
jgi:hypothetical protein